MSYRFYFGVLLVGAILLMTGGCDCSVPVEVKASEELAFEVDLDKILKENNIDTKKIFPLGKIPPKYKLTIPFSYKVNYDLRNHSQLKKYRDKIRDFQLNELFYRIEENTLSIDIPGFKEVLDVLLAKHEEKKEDAFQKIGYFFPIPAGKNFITDRLQVTDDGHATAAKFFKELAIALAIRGKLALDGSKDSTIPSGRLKLKVIVKVTFMIDVDI